MSYVDEVIEKVIAQNPAQPEFHQAVKEVLESLEPVVEKNPIYLEKGGDRQPESEAAQPIL